ncbi:TPA: hypothetical protein IX478_000456 [Enterococcus faecium]|uniref:hypothetical protein n=1 Tax=Enterococcus TaxID=1350 RepID=UPI000CD4643B|nr:MULTISPECIES: hypothetical protein [Enterococcus]HJE18419.1 hypothetical protein [Enterococcus casseliflavus]MDN3168351.1 hypothetical protein [Enterococcus faecalis]MDT2681277.1 hypothetical protein [Enterococcus gallinarum]MDT2682299.1 hypothetical protein [Enterococcus gallinarum]POH50018.1 hypothetical protein CV740_14690 [Enterococcus faecium]
MIALSGLFLFGIGLFGGYQLAHLPKWRILQKERAIRDYFEVKPNDYTYVEEGFDSYILSLDNQEYRIKFSKNYPIQVVYAEVLGVETE